MHTTFLFQNQKGRDHLEYLGAYRRIILKRILKKYIVRVWTSFTWLKIGTRGGFL
jgi:hypothetical protein